MLLSVCVLASTVVQEQSSRVISVEACTLIVSACKDRSDFAIKASDSNWHLHGVEGVLHDLICVGFIATLERGLWVGMRRRVDQHKLDACCGSFDAHAKALRLK